MGITADIRDVDVARYFPDVLANAKELQALASIENPEFTRVWRAIWKQMLNTFVYDLDTDGAARWEDMLSLHPGVNDTLDERKAAILLKINHSLPYTERTFQRMLDAAYGEGAVTATPMYNDYVLRMLITDMDVTRLLRRLYRFSRAIIPANLDIDIAARIETDAAKRRAFAPLIHRAVTISPEVRVTDFTAEPPVYLAGATVRMQTIEPAVISTGKTMYRAISMNIVRTITGGIG